MSIFYTHINFFTSIFIIILYTNNIKVRMYIISSIVNFFKKCWYYIKTGTCDESLLNSNDNSNDNETVQIHFYQIYGDRV